MENTAVERIDEILAKQKAFFLQDQTKNVKYRIEMLQKLLVAIERWESALADAVWKDLHKSYEEAFLTEISIVKGEIREHIKSVKHWAKKERCLSPITIFGSKSYIVKEPLGTALIVSPWNYPIQLLLNPLVGAISAGCTAVLKPSPYVPNVSEAIESMISETFDESYIAVVQGNRDVNGYLFKQKFDLIFFTGSPALARTVMKAAAEHLTPLVLELGGKSPCIIDKSADIKTAAKRIAWGKALNSGQTCIAPDYILIHNEVKTSFVNAFQESLKELYGDSIAESKHYVRIVSDKAFERVTGYLSEGTIICGGKTDAQSRFIEPTLIENMAMDSKIMTEEIFGPLFPVVTITETEQQSFLQQVVDFINKREKPLAFYYFGKEQDGWKAIAGTSSGGGCINDTIMHIVNPHIPFGGVGNSGMGHYHGKESFEAFTHRRSIVVTPTAFDLPFRYMPYNLFKVVKSIL